MYVDQSPPSQPLTAQQAQALVHYERGRRHYAAGRYRLAVRELERAFLLDPEGTNLQYNLGMVYERLGAVEPAARAYRRYLTGIEDPEERMRTQRILSRLRGARAELDAVSLRRGRADGLFWATTGAALASVGFGLTWVAVNHPEDADAGLGFAIGGLCLGALAAVLYFARDAPTRAHALTLP
jgi:tetratricopeptide (TPR) repeat protein